MEPEEQNPEEVGELIKREKVSAKLVGKDFKKFIKDNNAKYLKDRDLDFIIRIMTIMKEEYVKINTNID